MLAMMMMMLLLLLLLYDCAGRLQWIV